MVQADLAVAFASSRNPRRVHAIKTRDKRRTLCGRKPTIWFHSRFDHDIELACKECLKELVHGR